MTKKEHDMRLESITEFWCIVKPNFDCNNVPRKHLPGDISLEKPTCNCEIVFSKGTIKEKIIKND